MSRFDSALLVVPCRAGLRDDRNDEVRDARVGANSGSLRSTPAPQTSAQQSYGMVIFRTWPSPTGGGPKPTFETYKFPSGPKVMPVGKNRPVAMVVYLFFPSMRRIVPVFGVGYGFPVVFSST